jgi:exosome complex component RRP41
LDVGLFVPCYRAKLARLQREEREEVEQQQAEEEAREQEVEERQAELELEREQLEHASEQERARKETAQAIAAFRCQWLEEVNQALADPQCGRLSAAQKKEIFDAVEAEIEKRKPRDSPRMATILDVSELEAKEAMGPTVKEACRDIEQATARKERHARRSFLARCIAG